MSALAKVDVAGTERRPPFAPHEAGGFRWAPLLDALVDLGTPSPRDRTGLLRGLRDTLDVHADSLLAPPRRVERDRLLRLVMDCDDLPLVIWLGLAMHARGELAPALVLGLAEALDRVGREDTAAELLRQRMLAAPADHAAAARHARLGTRTPVPARFRPWDGDAARDGPVALVPLGPKHLRDFAWQYHDPAIACDCCLPTFEGDEDWLAWQAELRAAGDQLTLAVLHDDWGFVGSVSLVLHEGTGFFHYWIGPDFQGLGLGPRAGALLLRLARAHWGLRACLAKVFERNQASRKALCKIGFAPTGVSIAGGEEPELLYRLAEASAPPHETAAEAHALFAAMQGRTRVLYPLLATTRPLAGSRPHPSSTHDIPLREGALHHGC